MKRMVNVITWLDSHGIEYKQGNNPNSVHIVGQFIHSGEFDCMYNAIKSFDCRLFYLTSGVLAICPN